MNKLQFTITIIALTVIVGIMIARLLPIEETVSKPETMTNPAKMTANAAKAVEQVEEPEPDYEPSVQEKIILKCQDYNIPHEIPLAIAKLETGHFTSAAFLQGNNVGGMSINEVPITYESVDHGIDAFVQNLAENYYGQGLETVETIGGKYNPGNTEEWVAVVNNLIEE